MKDKTRTSDRSLDKEGNKEAAINRSIKKANYGDLLWVQLHGSSWWPAQVVDDSSVSAILKPRKRGKGEVLVRLYGSYNYLFVDPISSCLEFEDTLDKYFGSHEAILKETLKQDLHQLTFGTSKKKEMKMKGKLEADASQERGVKKKQNAISKTGTKKAPSAGRSSSRDLDADSPAKRSEETSLGPASTKESGSQKRKKEEAQRKSKSNSKKSVTKEKNKKKERKILPHNKTSASRKEEQDVERKKPKASVAVSRRTSLERASAGAARKTSLKRASSLLDKSEQVNNKKQKQSETQKNIRPNCPNSKFSRPQGSVKQGHSLTKKMGSRRTKLQTPNAAQKKLLKSHAAKMTHANKDSGRKNNAKASKQDILSTTLEETAKEPSARKLKVMRFLGLVSPAESPFIRDGSISNSA